MRSIKSLVDRGLELRAKIKSLKRELDEIENELAGTGLYAGHVPLKDPEREGRRFLAHGTRLVVPVIFTADKLMKTFPHESVAHGRIAAIANGHLGDFFEFSQVWANRFDDGQKFRQRAAEVLDKSAPPFISACLARDKHGIPKNDTKIAWDEAEDVTELQRLEH